MTVELLHTRHGDSWHFVGRWSDADRRAVVQSGIRRLVIDGTSEPTLEFLADVPLIEHLRIGLVGPDDARGIRHLRRLKSLDLDTYASLGVDFTQFPDLTKLKIEYASGVESIFDCHGLTDLSISHYPDRDLSRLAKLTQLRSLRIANGRGFQSLRGIEACRELEKLELLDLPVLRTLSGLAAVGTSLSWLNVNTARKLADIADVAACRSLEVLHFTDIGTIPTLDPLVGLPTLNWFVFNGTADLASGDLRPLLTLPSLDRVGLRSRRHYSPSADEIQRLVELRAKHEDARKRGGSRRNA